MIELCAGQLRLQVRPDLGGSLAGLWYRDQAVLRSTAAADLAESRLSACYPLLPYSNRVAHGRFNWGDQPYRAALNFANSPHPLHGVGWLRAWQVLAHSSTSLRLGYRHVPDAHWPFAFEAEQTITLDAHTLHLQLALTNTDHRTQPVGLGWHPYFVKRAPSRITLQVAQRWENDALHLPSHATPCHAVDARVSDLALDHCFDGWSGAAHISDDLFDLTLRSDLRHVVVFTPSDKAHYCVEPVSHRNNAIHAADPIAAGLRSVASGAALHAQMQLHISPHAP